MSDFINIQPIETHTEKKQNLGSSIDMKKLMLRPWQKTLMLNAVLLKQQRLVSRRLTPVVEWRLQNEGSCGVSSEMKVEKRQSRHAAMLEARKSRTLTFIVKLFLSDYEYVLIVII